MNISFFYCRNRIPDILFSSFIRHSAFMNCIKKGSESFLCDDETSRQREKPLPDCSPGNSSISFNRIPRELCSAGCLVLMFSTSGEDISFSSCTDVFHIPFFRPCSSFLWSGKGLVFPFSVIPLLCRFDMLCCCRRMVKYRTNVGKLGNPFSTHG